MNSNLITLKRNIIFRVALAALVLTFSLQSCYQYKVEVPTSTSRAVVKKPAKYTNWLWGIVRCPGYSVKATDCIQPSPAGQPNIPGTPLYLSSVTVKKSFGQLLVTLITLGIYGPVSIEWDCAQPAAQHGGINP